MFVPELNMKGYSGQEPFRFWCQKVLPLVYDESLSYYELLCKMMEYINNTIVDVKNVEFNLKEVSNSYLELVKYVNDYFSNLDVQNEINAKLDVMATDGTLTALIEPIAIAEIEAWLEEHITPTTPIVDNTLSIEGAAADSATVGKLALLTGNITITHDNANNYPDANNFAPNRTYNINASVVSGDPPDVANLPVYGTAGRLIYINTGSATNIAQTNNTGVQLYYTAYGFWYRLKTTSSFYPWTKISTWSDTESWVTNFVNNNDILVMSSNISVNATNYQTYQDIGSLTPNRIYSFTSSIERGMLTYLPSDAYVYDSETEKEYLIPGHMIIFASTYPNLPTYTGFVLFMNSQGTWYRTKTTSQETPFSIWHKIPYLDNNAIVSSNIAISASNAGDYLDADTLTPNKIYAITSNVTSDAIAHLPEYGVSGHLLYALSTHSPDVGFQLYVTQLNTWCRVKASGAFRDWYNVGNAYRGYQTERDFIKSYVDKTQIKFKSGSNVFVFGDSITTNNVNFGNTSWIEIIANLVNASLAQGETQFVGTTYGVSGTGFVAREGSPTTITDQIDDVDENAWDSCTLAIIAAGTNDYQSHGNWDTYRAAIESTITAIHSKKANLPILFITPIHCRSLIRDNTCADIAACIADVARNNLCSVINGFDIPIPPFSTDTFSDMTRVTINPDDPTDVSTDGLHPSATGIKIYAKSIISHVM